MSPIDQLDYASIFIFISGASVTFLNSGSSFGDLTHTLIQGLIFWACFLGY